MKLLVKDMDISTGGAIVAILNEADAAKLDLHHEDRVLLKKGMKKAVAIVNIAESKKAVSAGKIGLFEEALDALSTKGGDEVHLYLAEKPQSLHFIKKKLYGEELSRKEMHSIVYDLVENRITTVELAYFVGAQLMRGMSRNEVVYLTKAMIETGGKLSLKGRLIVDKHSIGGIPGNRTTPIIVSIVAAAGLICPKTSSRSITSPAGTADTMEVLCRVNYSIKDIKRFVKKNNGCIVWGGAVNLAPADDKIIKVESPLAIDPESQLVASIMAKKGSVCANHVLIDIPVGKTAKISDMKQAKHLASEFRMVGKSIGIKVETVISDGSQPIGNGLGPALEAKDVLYVLMNDNRQPLVLREKALRQAGIILEISKKALRGRGYEKAKYLLDSGEAYKKFSDILRAQEGKIYDPDQIKLGEFKYDYLSRRSGVVKEINNKAISKISRIAGTPKDKGAGIFIHKHLGEDVKRGEKLYTIYAESQKKLKYALNFLNLADGYVVG